MTRKVLVLGSTGMLGSMVMRVLKSSFSPDPFEVVGGVGSSNFKVEDFLRDPLSYSDWFSSIDYIVNCIGIIKPRIDERDKKSVKRAMEVNSLFPELLSDMAEYHKVHVYQIATDCVFGGDMGNYIESSPHDALDVYGKTKSLGEVVSPSVSHIRCSIIGPEVGQQRSLLEWFLHQPQGAELKGYKNHLWNGVSTLAFAEVVAGLMVGDIRIPLRRHLVPAGTVDKAVLLQFFKFYFNRPDITIIPTEAPIPVDRTLKTDDPAFNKFLWQLGGYEEPPTIEEMIKKLSEMK